MPKTRPSRRRIAALAAGAALIGSALALTTTAPAHAALTVCSGGHLGYIMAGPSGDLRDGYMIIWTGESCGRPTMLV